MDTINLKLIKKKEIIRDKNKEKDKKIYQTKNYIIIEKPINRKFKYF